MALTEEQLSANKKRLLEQAIAEKGDPTGARQKTLDKVNGNTATTVTGTETSVPTTTETPNTGGRDYTAEAEAIKKYGAPQNEQDELDLAIAVYGSALPKEYEDLKAKLETISNGNGAGLSDFGTSVSKFGQNALTYQQSLQTQRGNIPSEMNLLQDLLKKKSGVGNQALGTSEIFKEAGLTGYGSLSASLASNLDEMNMKHDSFANIVKTISASKIGQNTADLAKAQTMLDSYTMLRDEYKYETSRIDAIEKRKQDLEDSFALASYQHELDLDKMAREAELENNSSVAWQDLFTGGLGTNATYTSTDGTIYVTPGYTNADGERTVLGTKGQAGVFGSEFADNCVKYARQFVPNLPYGLWDIQDKANAVDPNIGKDQGEQGYAMLTAEGAYGHATVILTTDKKNRRYYVREANYTPGTITEGRWLSFDDPRILGFVAPGESKVKTSNQATAEALAGGNGFEDSFNQGLSVKYEGMNPMGAETYTPTQAYSAWDLASAYADVLSAKGVKLTDQDPEVKQFIFSYLASGDYAGAKQQILNTAIGSMASAEQQDIRSRYATVDALVSVKNSIMAYQAGGGNMGVFEGKVEDLTNKFGTSSNKDLQDIGAQLQVVMDNYIRMQSGAAITEDEQAFYEKLFPSKWWGGEFSLKRIDSLTNAISQTNKSLLSTTMQPDAYDKLFSPETLESERGWSDDTATSTNEAMRDIFGIY